MGCGSRPGTVVSPPETQQVGAGDGGGMAKGLTLSKMYLLRYGM